MGISTIFDSGEVLAQNNPHADGGMVSGLASQFSAQVAIVNPVQEPALSGQTPVKGLDLT